MLPVFVARQAVAPEPDRDAVRDRWVRVWSRALIAAFGLRAVVRGVAPSGSGPRLVVANHRSAADILLLLSTFGGAMVSRADVAGWPLFGVAARVAGTVFVDRASARSGASAVRAIQARLERRSTVIVFPEGTTFADDEVRPFHAGAFVAAARAQAEVLPVGLAYASGSGAAFVQESFAQHLSRMAAAPPSRVALAIGEPLRADPSTPPPRLTDLARAEVARLVAVARAEVDR
jgi:1-acyl-sn-glycerol-3-phosphate acyltransferase